MAVIWCAISSHGFGHAAQVLPVLHALAQRVPDLRVVLRTAVPARLFERRLSLPTVIQPAVQDIGCMQADPVTIDVAATWEAHVRFHEAWNARVREETDAIRAASPRLVLSDIPSLAIESGAKAGVPAIGLGNLSWDLVLAQLRQPVRPEETQVLQQIRTAYQQAELILRPAPGLALTAFRKVVDLPAIARMLPADPSLRARVGAGPGERLVVVGFGGIALKTLPFERLETLKGYRFLVFGQVPQGLQRVSAAESFGVSFGTVLASADLLVTKPGYSTVVEAVALRKPVVYVRRYNFADEPSLVDYLHRYGRAAELSAGDFSTGNWRAALERVTALPEPPPAPEPTGAQAAAAILAEYL